MNRPRDWQRVCIRDVTLSTSTWNPQAEPRDTICYVDVSAVSRETLQIVGAEEIPATAIPSRARKLIRGSDTIFATIRPSLKRVAKVPPTYKDDVASTAFCILRPNSSIINPDFLFFVASSERFVEEVAGFETGASYPAVRDGDILTREFLLPPMQDQVSIAKALHLVRESVLLQISSISLAEKLKDATMQALFTRGLRGEAQKDTEIGLVPESWEQLTIADICHIWSGGTPSKSVAEFWTGDVPWVSGKDLKSPALDDTIDHVTHEGVEAASRLAPTGSALLLVRGMGLAKDLPIAVINRPMAFNQDVKALVPRGQCSGQFLRSAIYVGKERLLAKIVPSAHGTMTLNLDDVESFKIAFPKDVQESNEIVAILDVIDRKIGHHRRKRAVLDGLFKALVRELLSGAVGVSELDLSALSPAASTAVAA